jgi:hypothetical protein
MKSNFEPKAPREPKRRSSNRRRNLSQQRTAFLNVPYDRRYERLYLAFIAGLCGFRLIPRATIEIPGSERQLDRIIGLIRSCRYSFHDLSRVEIDRSSSPATPRFNMPFELGLAVARRKNQRTEHQWFVFESHPHRLSKSLSDLDGTDPYIHGGTPEGVLRALTNALTRTRNPPTFTQLEGLYHDLRKAAYKLRRDLKGGSLFEARPFRDLVVLAGIASSKLR